MKAFGNQIPSCLLCPARKGPIFRLSFTLAALAELSVLQQNLFWKGLQNYHFEAITKPITESWLYICFTWHFAVSEFSHP